MTPVAPHEVEDIEIQLLLEALFQRYHYDFRHYARASIKRRLLQARSHFGLPSLTALQERVLHDPEMLPRASCISRERLAEGRSAGAGDGRGDGREPGGREAGGREGDGGRREL